MRLVFCSVQAVCAGSVIALIDICLGVAVAVVVFLLGLDVTAARQDRGEIHSCHEIDEARKGGV